MITRQLRGTTSICSRFVRRTRTSLLSPTQIARRDALRSRLATATTYIGTGDSTMDNTYNRMASYYYPHMLSKVGITFVDNAKSGLTTDQWNTNVYSGARVSDAIAAIPNTGATTVWEYRLGINDYAGGGTPTKAALLAQFKAGIDAVLAAKPDTMIFFVEPVAVYLAERNTTLNEVYADLAEFYDRHIVKLYQPMRNVYDAGAGNLYYKDSTHPTANGSFRAVNFILSDILSDSQLGSMTYDTSYYTGVLTTSVTTGSYWNASGTLSVNASWSCFEQVPVTAGSTICVKHGGNRADVRWHSSAGVIHSTATGPASTDANGSYYTVPTGVTLAGVNISSTTYTVTGTEQISVVGGQGVNDMTMTQINTGLTLRF